MDVHIAWKLFGLLRIDTWPIDPRSDLDDCSLKEASVPGGEL